MTRRLIHPQRNSIQNDSRLTLIYWTQGSMLSDLVEGMAHHNRADHLFSTNYSSVVSSKFIRICPGRHLAESFLWEAMVTVLATARIVKKLDHEGKEIVPVPEFTGGGVR